MQKKSKIPAVLAGVAGFAAAVAVYDKLSGDKSVVKKIANSFFCSGSDIEVEEVPYLNLRAGDHIVTQECDFTHHGVWTGNDVIQCDIDPEDQGKVTVHRVPLDTFLAQGDAEWIYLYNRRKCVLRALPECSPAYFERQEIVERAESQLGVEEDELTTQKSEAFVKWCRAGE